jgi:hypothetical protein
LLTVAYTPRFLGETIHAARENVHQPARKYTCARACAVPATDCAVAGIDPSASIITTAITRIASLRHNTFMTRSTFEGPQ